MPSIYSVKCFYSLVYYNPVVQSIIQSTSVHFGILLLHRMYGYERQLNSQFERLFSNFFDSSQIPFTFSIAWFWFNILFHSKEFFVDTVFFKYIQFLYVQTYSFGSEHCRIRILLDSSIFLDSSIICYSFFVIHFQQNDSFWLSQCSSRHYLH